MRSPRGYYSRNASTFRMPSGSVSVSRENLDACMRETYAAFELDVAEDCEAVAAVAHWTYSSWTLTSYESSLRNMSQPWSESARPARISAHDGSQRKNQRVQPRHGADGITTSVEGRKRKTEKHGRQNVVCGSPPSVSPGKQSSS
jgi:hypothetical protein